MLTWEIFTAGWAIGRKLGNGHRRMGPLWVQFTGRDAFRLEMSGRFTDGIPVQNNSLCFPLFKPENIASANLYEELDRVMASLKKLADRLRLEAGGTLSKSPS
jgi:hypothetical protein